MSRRRHLRPSLSTTATPPPAADRAPKRSPKHRRRRLTSGRLDRAPHCCLNSARQCHFLDSSALRKRRLISMETMQSRPLRPQFQTPSYGSRHGATGPREQNREVNVFIFKTGPAPRESGSPRCHIGALANPGGLKRLVSPPWRPAVKLRGKRVISYL